MIGDQEGSCLRPAYSGERLLGRQMDKWGVVKSQNSVARIAERYVFERRIQIRTQFRDENIVTADSCQSRSLFRNAIRFSVHGFESRTTIEDYSCAAGTSLDSLSCKMRMDFSLEWLTTQCRYSGWYFFWSLVHPQCPTYVGRKCTWDWDPPSPGCGY